MTAQKLWIWPAPVLDTPCKKVEKFDSSLWAILDDCRDTMINVEGVGCAAPQIGHSIRAAVVRLLVSPDGKQVSCLDMVNPEIISEQDPVELDEGCLSLPGERAMVKRFKEIVLKFYDRQGIECYTSFTGEVAHIVQHEVDHLNGLVYPRHLSSLKRDILRKKMLKFQSGINQRVAQQQIRKIIEEKAASGDLTSAQVEKLNGMLERGK